MKNGYEQFFKEAQKATGLAAGAKPPKEAASRERVRASHSETPEQHLRRELSDRVKSKRAKKRLTRRARKFPVMPGLIAVLSFGFGAFGFFRPDLADRLLSKVDIEFFGSAHAATEKAPAKKAEAKKTDGKSEEKGADKTTAEKEKSAETSVAAKDEKIPDVKNWTEEELSFFKKLNERKKELDQRESELTKLEEELQKQKTELDQKIKRLESMRTDISKTLQTRVASDQEKVEKLVNLYSSMKPDQAAKIIESLNEDLAVEVLDKLKKKSAAEIMNMMDAKKARRLSELLTGYQRTPASESAAESESGDASN